MQITILLYVIALFYVLTPGVLFSFPKKCSKKVVALTHAVIFALVFHFTYKLVWNIASKFEGFKLLPKPAPITKGQKPEPITKPLKVASQPVTKSLKVAPQPFTKSSKM